jgi:hypothetical protein
LNCPVAFFGERGRSFSKSMSKCKLSRFALDSSYFIILLHHNLYNFLHFLQIVSNIKLFNLFPVKAFNNVLIYYFTICRTNFVKIISISIYLNVNLYFFYLKFICF